MAKGKERGQGPRQVRAVPARTLTAKANLPQEVLQVLAEYEARLDAVVFKPPDRPPPTLCHYTTYEGLAGILSDRGFLARHHAETNDARELQASDSRVATVAQRIAQRRHGHSSQLLSYFSRKHPENALSKVADVFIASFTSERDELLHWKNYGRGGSGVCLIIKVLDEQHEIPGLGLQTFRVTYEPPDWENRLETAFEGIVDEFEGMARHPSYPDRVGRRALVAMARVAGIAAMSSKVEEWRQEKEWRVVAMRDEICSIPIVSPPGRSGRAILLPARSNGLRIVAEEIIWGAKEDPRVAQARIRSILTSAGYPGVDAPMPRIAPSRFKPEDM